MDPDEGIERPLPAIREGGKAAAAALATRLGPSEKAGMPPPPRSAAALAWAATLALLACGADPPRPPATLTDELTRQTLDNGLEVVVVRRRTSPIVVAQAALRAGASVEDSASDGYAHLLEHMVFEGCAEIPDATAFRDRLRELGARFNGATSADRVVYSYHLPTHRVSQGLALMSSALRTPQIDEAALAREIEVVLAEFDLYAQNWESAAWGRLYKLLFSDHPYRQDPLGTRAIVEGATREALLELHSRYYLPNNALVVLAGDVEPQQGLQLVREHFGTWEPGPDAFAASAGFEHTPLVRNAAAIATAPVSDARLLVAWQGPGARTDPRGSRAAAVLSMITFLSDHSFRRLVGAPAVLSAGLTYDRAPGTGALVIELRIGRGYEREAVDMLREELSGLALAGDIAPHQLEAARAEVWTSRLHSHESAAAAASLITDEWGDAGLDDYEQSIDDLYRLRIDDVSGVAQRYIHGRPKAIVLLTTEDQVASQRLTAEWLERAL